MATTVMLVAIAGGLGAALRFGLSLGLIAWAGAWLPWGTLAANVLGSFALGLVMESQAVAEARPLGADLRVVLGAGLLGGFTTYSSFNLETLRLLQAGAPERALLYAAGTFALCLAAALAGARLGGA